MLRHRWEVFFITQRPFTAGETVQRQTQRWLVAQGFDLPSVLVLHGSRGTAAAALRLDYHVDDRPQNCIDVSVDSNAKTILIVPEVEQDGDRERAEARHRRRSPHRRGAGHPRPGHARADQSQPLPANCEDGRLEMKQSESGVVNAQVDNQSRSSVDSRSRVSRQSRSGFSRTLIKKRPEALFASGHRISTSTTSDF